MLYEISLLKRSKQISLLGAFLGLLGSFIMVMDYLTPFKFVIDQFSPWSDLHIAQSIMDKRSIIKSGEAGFSELKDLISESSGLSTYSLSSVIKAKGMSISIGRNQASVPFYTYHAIYSDGTSVGLGTEGIIRNWIKTNRDRSFIFWGVLFLSIGFIMTAWSHFIKDKKVLRY
ncbi:hypothetical protein [Pseudoalteromonas sp. BSi20495]|uniref:hypothetical protein n=1 Tax=Pseudoalteromonas sp. BSi20495 TaxID=386429 RepID=UPI0002316517|nr:hypothetical protein [Pseudoalteromonas sp. BSi20495]GAA77974.1 hypothetical protein P20495_0464 [Pseudoalteromonas sp. BSi20495]